MASIDDIWDAPVTRDSPKGPRHLDTDDDDTEGRRPLKRQKQALFLSDSEDESGNGSGMRRGVLKAPPAVADPGIEDDVEAIFADAENDQALSFKKIGDLDVAAMEKEAEERHRRPLTPHPVMPSSSPTRDNGTAGDAAGGLKNDKGKNKDSKKRARPVPLNENLLLGPTGFPELISQVTDFKVKGKGRERKHKVEDLTRLMRVYNFWTHKLHPKLKFRDTVVRIEKLCHAKRMQVALSVWRDEAHGKVREIDGDLLSDSDNNVPTRHESNRNTTSEAITTPPSLPSCPETDCDHLSLPPSSRASSQPPNSDFPDDGDLFGPSTSSHFRPNGTSAAVTKRIVVSDEDEDEGLWRDLEAARALEPAQRQSSKPQVVPTQSIDDLDDAEMWAALGEITNQSSATSGRIASRNAPTISGQVDEMDIDDDDMWDIIKENEESAQTHQPIATDPAVSAPRSMEHISPQKLVAESEMGWDDIYAD